jgi:ABC-2 type transport system permease protein
LAEDSPYLTKGKAAMAIFVKTVEKKAEKGASDWVGLFVGIYTLWLKHMRKFRTNWMEVGGTLVTPVLWLLLFGVCMSAVVAELDKNATGGLNYMTYITPGVMLLTGLTAAVLSGATLLIERVNGVIKEYLVAPVPRLAVLLGTMASGLTKALLQVGVVLLMGFALSVRPVTDLAALLAGLAVITVYCLGFVGVAAAFASRSRSMESYHTLIMVMNLPVLFLSNALYPLAEMPTILRIGALLNPTTYAIDATRHLLYGSPPEIHLWVSLSVLGVFLVGGLWYGYRNFQRWVVTPVG